MRAGSTASPEIDTIHELDLQDPWQVVLLDDDDHTYDYVIEMLMEIFDHPDQLALQMACEVDASGRVVVDVTTEEKARRRVGQIHAYGPDWRLERSQGGMSADTEPAIG